jgi:hypothetical protein
MPHKPFNLYKRATTKKGKFIYYVQFYDESGDMKFINPKHFNRIIITYGIFITIFLYGEKYSSRNDHETDFLILLLFWLAVISLMINSVCLRK